MAIDNGNDSKAQQEHERENVGKDVKNPATEGFDKKMEGPNRPAE